MLKSKLKFHPFYILQMFHIPFTVWQTYCLQLSPSWLFFLLFLKTNKTIGNILMQYHELPPGENPYCAYLRVKQQFGTMPQHFLSSYSSCCCCCCCSCCCALTGRACAAGPGLGRTGVRWHLGQRGHIVGRWARADHTGPSQMLPPPVRPLMTGRWRAEAGLDKENTHLIRLQEEV